MHSYVHFYHWPQKPEDAVQTMKNKASQLFSDTLHLHEIVIMPLALIYIPN